MAGACAVASRPARRRAASTLVLIAALAPLGAAAQSPTLEASYVVLGPQGPVARAVLANATTCPAITIDGAQQAMSVRAQPDAMFRVLVCEKPIPADAKSASIALAGSENSLPVLKSKLASIAAFGDTGCRLKTWLVTRNDPDDDEYRGKFQDCNIPSRWPFAQLAASVAAAKPDLVIHVGDYSTARAPARPATAAARAVPTATTGPPGKPISSSRRHRHCARRRGSWSAATMRSAPAPGPAISACSIRPRSGAAALRRPHCAVHHHGGRPIVHRLRLQQCQRFLPLR